MIPLWVVDREPEWVFGKKNLPTQKFTPPFPLRLLFSRCSSWRTSFNLVMSTVQVQSMPDTSPERERTNRNHTCNFRKENKWIRSNPRKQTRGSDRSQKTTKEVEERQLGIVTVVGPRAAQMSMSLVTSIEFLTTSANLWGENEKCYGMRDEGHHYGLRVITMTLHWHGS
jgi:hypothetical protein